MRCEYVFAVVVGIKVWFQAGTRVSVSHAQSPGNYECFRPARRSYRAAGFRFNRYQRA
jgi:hypothetical protein